MVRYGRAFNKREIVLLKGYPCVWGRCTFCDYILDNSQNELEMVEQNHRTLQNVTGQYGALEVINSGSVFEIPAATLNEIKKIAKSKCIDRLFFESHYGYKHRLNEIRELYSSDIIFKCGIETFDHHFRNDVLKKGIVFKDYHEISDYFESVCLLVGVRGQTREMIKKDIEILTTHFRYGCVNLYVDNSTDIKSDHDLKQWFKEEYGRLDRYPNIDVLWENTEFGVGSEAM